MDYAFVEDAEQKQAEAEAEVARRNEALAYAAELEAERVRRLDQAHHIHFTAEEKKAIAHEKGVKSQAAVAQRDRASRTNKHSGDTSVADVRNTRLEVLRGALNLNELSHIQQTAELAMVNADLESAHGKPERDAAEAERDRVQKQLEVLEVSHEMLLEEWNALSEVET